MPPVFASSIPWAEAADQIERFANLFDPSQPFDPCPVRRGERLVAAALERLPLTQGQMCYCRNRLESCRRLYAAREWGAARYQLRELLRKVRHLEAVWALAFPSTAA
jgi:hypothetical protein